MRVQRLHPGERLAGMIGRPLILASAALATGGAGLLLLGENSGPASPDTALFASADGAVWQPLTDDPRLHRDVAVAMAVRGTGILAVTERWDGTSSVLHAWRGTAR